MIVICHFFTKPFLCKLKVRPENSLPSPDVLSWILGTLNNDYDNAKEKVLLSDYSNLFNLSNALELSVN